MENEMIELVARTIDVPPEELVEWLESRQKVEHQEKPPLSPWLSRKAAAEYASVSTDTIDNWCASGLIEKSKSLSTNKLILIAPCAILSSRKNNGGKHGNDKAENMGNNG